MQRGLLLVVTAVCLDFGLTYATMAADMPFKAPIGPP